jgi:SAM-dependent methyltransferase
MSDAMGGTSTPAEIYNRFLGPAVFAPLAETLLARANLVPGERVVDAGCGTGIVSRAAARLAGSAGLVTGVDRNPAMLAVARAQPAEANAAPIEWLEADAAAIPLPDGGASLVSCQQMLQFVPDPVAVLAEFRRLLRPGGRIAVAVWTGAEEHPFHQRLDAVLARHLGQPALADGFSLGDEDRLRCALEAAGFPGAAIERTTVVSRFADPASAVRGLIVSASAGIPSFRQLDGAAREQLLSAVERDAAPIVSEFTDTGALVYPWRSLLTVATKD